MTQEVVSVSSRIVFLYMAAQNKKDGWLPIKLICRGSKRGNCTLMSPLCMCYSKPALGCSLTKDYKATRSALCTPLAASGGQ